MKNTGRKPRKINLYKLLTIVFLTAFALGSIFSAAVSISTFKAAPRVYYVQNAPTREHTPVMHELKETDETAQVPTLDPRDVEYIGRTIWGEAGGVQSEAERAAVAWCILNRVDASGDSIEEVVTAPSQFHGYRPNGDCPQAHLDLAADVLTRWQAEKNGETHVGRTLPASYLYFIGDGERNHFSKEYGSTAYWDWTLINPYI